MSFSHLASAIRCATVAHVLVTALGLGSAQLLSACIRSHSSRRGPPAASHASSSARFQRTERPRRMGRGRRPEELRPQTCLGEMLNNWATASTEIARHLQSVFLSFVMPAFWRAAGRSRGITLVRAPARTGAHQRALEIRSHCRRTSPDRSGPSCPAGRGSHRAPA